LKKEAATIGMVMVTAYAVWVVTADVTGGENLSWHC